ncbi:MAG: ATP synthase F1 subunit delta [Bdellovibrionales bacterium]|nr:ATP synthase F1 subunit delta [Bdellovibrionales bacterium]
MSQVAERYALALFEVAEKKGTVETTEETLSALAQSIRGNQEVLKVLGSPLVSSDEKVSLLKTALGGAMTEELTTFFDLLAKNNRLDFIPEIVDAFQSVISKTTGIMSGEVTSASELSDQEKSKIKAMIESKLARKVELKYIVKPDMIGGVEAKVGSYIFEDSIKSHMQKLNEFITRRV